MKLLLLAQMFAVCKALMFTAVTPRPLARTMLALNSRGSSHSVALSAKKGDYDMGAPQDKEKMQALEGVLTQIERNYGRGSILRLGSPPPPLAPSNSLSTGSLTLDVALGGGLPRGRVVEIYGPESSGKTTLALHCVAEAQKNGGTAAFIDAEHALDPSYAKRVGVNVEKLLCSQPDSGEMALDIVDQLVRSR